MTSPTTDRRYGVSPGLGVKAPCRLATTAAITLSGLQSIDGVTTVANDRVLVKDQASSVDNGVYVADTGAWTRDIDFNGNRDIVMGTIITVNSGNTNTNTLWRVTTANPITIGTSAITFTANTSSATSSSAISFLQAGTGAVERTAQAKMREHVSILDFIPVAEHAAIQAATSTYDCRADIIAAIASFPDGNGNIYYSQAGTLFFPPGKYYCSDSIEVERAVHFLGANAAKTSNSISASTIEFAQDKNGFILHAYNTGTSGKGGDSTVFENLSIIQESGSTLGSGLWARCRFIMRACSFYYWGANGILVQATAGSGGITEGNANNFHIENCVSSVNVGNGYKCDGGDTNAATIIGLDCSSNGGYGIWESSFLGNTYVGCHVAGNTSAGYYTDTNNNNRSLFLGCYSESGAPLSDIRSTAALIIGGLSSGFEATTTAAQLNTEYLYLNENTQFLHGIASSTSQWELYLPAGGIGPTEYFSIAALGGGGGLRTPGISFRDEYYAAQGNQVPPAIYSANAGTDLGLDSGSTGTYQGKTKLTLLGGFANGFTVDFSSDRGATYTNQLTLDSSGHFKSGFDNTKTLGTAAKRWSEVFAGNAAINTSDAREKQQVKSLSDAEHRVAVRCKSLIRSFKFNDAVVAKGDKARIHFGVMSQDVKAAFEAEGLVAEDYSMFCYDEWPELPEIKEPALDDDGNPTEGFITLQAYRPSGSRYGIRYEELLAFIIGAL